MSMVDSWLANTLRLDSHPCTPRFEQRIFFHVVSCPRYQAKSLYHATRNAELA